MSHNTVLEQFEQNNFARLTEGKAYPEFQAGDTVRVNVRIVEGKTERVQAFEGLCIAKRNRGINSAFTVRKISHGEGVERIFPLYSPLIESVTVVRKGVVRRAKLYYMRELTGKAARITERREFAVSETDASANKKSANAAVESKAPAENA